ncbi:MAG: hypothetical protein NZZ41_06855, partial [Candidatus Dojkabacteria bacterium]|nr:hypothetical protein [Candidatus Dojkabacteria bacterium]
YSVLLPATSLYAVLVTGQFRNFDEFAPVYQKLLVPVGPVDKVYSATEREILLTKRVNSLATYNGYWVFNNNFTTNSTTIFKEENIRRLANAVARNLKIVLKQFVGRINNKKTREEVVEKVKQMLARTIDINRYKPDDYIITCDESNNTDNHNYLYVDIAIKMPMSIKYIHLTTVAMPI